MIIFFLFSIIAMFFYPGGSEFRLNQEGYRIFHNYFSDLGMITAWNQQSNVISAIIFNFALVFSSMTIIPFIYNYHIIFDKKSRNWYIAQILRITGILTVICFIGIGIFMKDIFFNLHVFFTWTGFVIAFPFSILFAILNFRTQKFPKKYGFLMVFLGILMLIYIVLYILFPEENDNLSHILKVVEQKIIVYYMLFTLLMQAFGIINLLNE